MVAHYQEMPYLWKFLLEILDLLGAGLPQGSPLPLLSYILYNADLVEIPITVTEGGLGFVDDFSAWVIGNTAAENLARVKNEVIPRAVQWARANGAEFEKSKTGLIHFTRNALKNPRPYEAILFEASVIAPQESLKLLGVTLNQQLRMKEHVSNSAAKAIQRCLAIKRLRGIKPKAMRQLYSTAVTSITDYAASVWYKP